MCCCHRIYDDHFSNFVTKLQKGMPPRVGYEVGLTYLSAYHEVVHLLGELEGREELRTHTPHASVVPRAFMSSDPGSFCSIEGLPIEFSACMRDASHRKTVLPPEDDPVDAAIRVRRRSTATGDSLLLVKREHRNNINEMTMALQQVRAKFTTDVKAFEKQYVTTRILLKQQRVIDHMQHEGELVDLDATVLRAEIDSELSTMTLEPLREHLGFKTKIDALGAFVIPHLDKSVGETVGQVGQQAAGQARQVGRCVQRAGVDGKRLEHMTGGLLRKWSVWPSTMSLKLGKSIPVPKSSPVAKSSMSFSTCAGRQDTRRKAEGRQDTRKADGTVKV